MKKKQVPRYYTVREIKTGRVFQAEYDSESAAYYEKGTGKEYDIVEVEHYEGYEDAMKELTNNHNNSKAEYPLGIDNDGNLVYQIKND